MAGVPSSQCEYVPARSKSGTPKRCERLTAFPGARFCTQCDMKKGGSKRVQLQFTTIDGNVGTIAKTSWVVYTLKGSERIIGKLVMSPDNKKYVVSLSPEDNPTEYGIPVDRLALDYPALPGSVNITHDAVPVPVDIVLSNSVLVPPAPLPGISSTVPSPASPERSLPLRSSVSPVRSPTVPLPSPILPSPSSSEPESKDEKSPEKKIEAIPPIIETSLACDYVVFRTGFTSRLVTHFLMRGCSFDLEYSSEGRRRAAMDMRLTPSILATGVTGYTRTYDAKNDNCENITLNAKPLFISDDMYGDGTYYTVGETHAISRQIFDVIEEKEDTCGTIAFKCNSIPRAFRYAQKLEKLGYCPYLEHLRPLSLVTFRKGDMTILWMDFHHKSE